METTKGYHVHLMRSRLQVVAVQTYKTGGRKKVICIILFILPSMLQGCVLDAGSWQPINSDYQAVLKLTVCSGDHVICNMLCCTVEKSMSASDGDFSAVQECRLNY
jgi:hypothetical protein